MSVRARSILSLAGAAAATALVLTGCGGGEKKADSPDKTEAAATKLAPLPKVAPADVKALAGRWVGTRKDYFFFKPDGTGVWMKDKNTLWSGQAIPESRSKFRFSWQGGDPKTASYWGAEVSADGKKMTFAGTNQTYTKAKA
ncbi:hypothetical protein ACGFNU_18310 [Spirillospora sp. NPDC048911]|uniref:hypothetical protein n=1 Tax=Spirillospora sp. NPDC048911 TaxID=3364527 RepID=UPI00371AC38C